MRRTVSVVEFVCADVLMTRLGRGRHPHQQRPDTPLRNIRGRTGGLARRLVYFFRHLTPHDVIVAPDLVWLGSVTT